MILGTGIDVVSVSRLRRSVERYSDRFLMRVFTEAEIAYCRGSVRFMEHLAGRFAAKEAVLKALGTGVSGGASMRDVEIVRREAAAPEVVLHGRTGEIARNMGVRRVHISISHAADIAMAQAIVEK